MAVFWFSTFIILLVIEIITINLVSIWFALGAIAAFIFSFIFDSIIIQTVVFIFVSVLSLLITKPLMKKFKLSEIVPTNYDRVIGREAIVTKEITKDHYGEVKVLGTFWTACCEEKVTVNTKVKVLAIDGVKLIVRKEEE